MSKYFVDAIWKINIMFTTKTEKVKRKEVNYLSLKKNQVAVIDVSLEQEIDHLKSISSMFLKDLTKTVHHFWN